MGLLFTRVSLSLKVLQLLLDQQHLEQALLSRTGERGVLPTPMGRIWAKHS